ncbi:hypothetical protein ACROYT_G027253 [Oculina patagonica]
MNSLRTDTRIYRMHHSLCGWSVFILLALLKFTCSGDDRSKRSTHERKIRDTTKDTDVYKYLEGALIVPKSYEEKYGKDKFATVLLVIANLWCIGGKCVDNGRPRIHGGWSAWPSVYSSCTRPCGGGVQYRTRVCRNPVSGSTAIHHGDVEDGTRCTLDLSDLDVCVQGSCRYVAVKGGNPGLDYSFKRPVKPSETPPERKFEWDVTPWSACSTTCGQGVKTRTARCIRSDDKTPASDRACGKKESTSEPCQVTPCPSNWYQTPWSDCSQSCGRGVQTRNVICRMKINPTEYGPSTNCSAEDKPNITETSRYCNSIACLSDWDTKDGFVRDKCGKPFKKNELKCYHMDQFGEKSRIPNLLCRYREKPTRLPCTTPSPPTTPTTPTPTQGNKADADKKARGSQSIQAQSSVFLAFLIPLLQILL